MSHHPKSMPPVPIKHSLKQSIRKAEIKQFCVKYFVENQLGAACPSGSPEIIKFVCNVIENSIPKGNKHKIDKLELCLDIVASVCPSFGQPEKEAAKVLVGFMLAHKQIKRQPLKFFMRKLFVFLGDRFSL